MKIKCILSIFVILFFSCSSNKDKSLAQSASYDETLEWIKERVTEYVNDSLQGSQHLEVLNIEDASDIYPPSEEYIQNRKAYNKINEGESATISISSSGNEHDSGIRTFYSRRQLDEIDMEAEINQGKEINVFNYAPIVNYGETKNAISKVQEYPIFGAIASYIICENEKRDTIYSYFFFDHSGKYIERGRITPIYEKPFGLNKNGDYHISQ